MTFFTRHPRLVASSLGVLGCLSFSGAARAQATLSFDFSIDWHGPSVSVPDSAFGFPITEGDILSPVTGMPAFGPLPAPVIRYSAGFAPAPGLGLGTHAGCVGHAPGTPCGIELDALDYGRGQLIAQGIPLKGRLMFSVDRFAIGGGPVPPNVFSENAPGIFEGSGDAFVALGLGMGPTPPFAAPMPGNTAVIDGNGMISGSGFTYKGVGIVEPNPPGGGPLAPGDNLDAMAMGFVAGPLGFPPLGIWFSLDSGFVDPATGVPNSGTAVANGFTGGMVLHSLVPGGPPVVYAPAPLLGLDFFGPDSDDLDALVIHENGLAGYQPSIVPNDWVGAGATDMLLFSVRRGSALIGLPDSIFGLPITEGDILTRPLAPGAGGVSPFPGIYYAAENLGLLTVRMPGVLASDELDALEISPILVADCNGNGVEDAYDIATGAAGDVNLNGIPDSCELFATPYCFCPAPLGPCGNNDPTAGCINSTGVGGLLTATGTSSVANDDLVLTGTQLPPNKLLVMLMSPVSVAPVPFYNGLRCVGGPPLFRHPGQVISATGTVTYGPGLSAFTLANFGPLGWILPGSTFHFQDWHRDSTVPCGLKANLTNAVQVTFTP